MNNNKYLRSSFFCESDSFEIKSLADRIISSSNTTDVCKTLFLWVRDNIKYTFRPVFASAKKYVKFNLKNGNCFNKNNLFIALCRSKGIPARYCIVKIVFEFKKINKKIELFHITSEVLYNKKWRIFDTSFEKNALQSKIKNYSEFKEIKTKPLIRLREFSLPLLTMLYLLDLFSISARRVRIYLDKVAEVNVAIRE